LEITESFLRSLEHKN